MSTFLGKLKEVGDQVKAGAQEKLHEAQLRAQLRTLEREKTELLTTLGTALYAMHQAGEIHLDTLHGQFETIDAVDLRMQEKQHEIDDFLAHPGAASAPSSGAQSGGYEDQNRHCTCGAVLSPAAKFCPECGRPNQEPIPEEGI